MKIADYKCKCGKWLKWANKNERNLFIKQHLNEIYKEDV